MNCLDILEGNYPPKEPTILLLNLFDIPLTVDKTLEALAQIENVIGVTVVIRPGIDKIIWGGKEES